MEVKLFNKVFKPLGRLIKKKYLYLTLISLKYIEMERLKTTLTSLTLIFLLLLGCKDDEEEMGQPFDFITENTEGYPVIYNCETFVPVRGLVAHYPLDGNAMDASGYQNHGIINEPVPAVDRKMNEDGAFHFNGDDDVILIKDSQQSYLGCEFTISAWIYPESIKTQSIIRKGSGTGTSTYSHPFGLSLSKTNDMIFTVTSSEEGPVQVRKPGYDINTWYLITGVMKDQMLYLYINGVMEASEPISGMVRDDGSSLLIGTRLRLPSSTFEGIIDDVKLYDYALSDQEILALFNE